MNEGGWMGVDLDGTLAHYDGWKGVGHIGEPLMHRAIQVESNTGEMGGGKIMTWTTEDPNIAGWFWIKTENGHFPLQSEPEKDFQGTVFSKAAAYKYYGAKIVIPMQCAGPIQEPDE